MGLLPNYLWQQKNKRSFALEPDTPTRKGTRIGLSRLARLSHIREMLMVALENKRVDGIDAQSVIELDKLVTKIEGRKAFRPKSTPFLLALLAALMPAQIWAAFPTIAASNSGASSAAGTTVTVTFPSGSTTGDLVVVHVSARLRSTTITWPAGWTPIQDLQETCDEAVNGEVRYRRFTGSEGASMNVTLGASQRWAWWSYRITGHHASTDPEGGTPAQAGCANLTIPNPPALTPSWGAEDTLFIAATNYSEHPAPAVTAYPTNYSLSQINARDSGDADTAGVGVAARQLNAASDNPGTFTLASPGGAWVAGTIAVRPAAGAAATCPRTLLTLGVGC